MSSTVQCTHTNNVLWAIRNNMTFYDFSMNYLIGLSVLDHWFSLTHFLLISVLAAWFYVALIWQFDFPPFMVLIIAILNYGLCGMRVNQVGGLPHDAAALGVAEQVHHRPHRPLHHRGHHERQETQRGTHHLASATVSGVTLKT
ncbi:hypothetical protein RHGRI_023222 [Rhododendron griersonianum]|uniref:Uncharacterized protein n=1 Tax=Rhododendron griersonianum TaxID=479676 RepID=A0AAV6J873_9ERIC|nr:hypothetical protein RHGRI_023222 [Rhododendron griersonianum]